MGANHPVAEQPLQADNLPRSLRNRQQWLLWRYEQQQGDKKPRKVPYYINGSKRRGEQGSTEDRQRLATLEEALRALAAGRFSGVGFAFLPGDGLIGIDIDGAIDGNTGEVSERCRSIIGACASYTELSPSGRGVHIIVAGDSETFKDNAIGLEVFCGRQFFTCTGRRWPDTPDDVLPIADDVLRRLKVTVRGAQTSAPRPVAQPAAKADDLAQRLESALPYLSADMEYDDWVMVGMAIKAALGDGGFSLWDYWSSKGKEYPGSEHLRRKWASFSGSGVTETFVFKRALAAGWRAPKANHAASGGHVPDGGAEAADVAAELAARARDTSPKPPADEWPDPIMPGAAPVPEIPPALLPTWLGKMAAAVSRATQTPTALSVMLGLSVLSTVLQRRVEVEPTDGYTEPLSLWTLTALPSGTRKTAVLGAMTAPIVAFEKRERDRMRGPIGRVTAARAVAKKRIEHLLLQAAKAKESSEREQLRIEVQREEAEMPDELRAPRWFTGDCTPERLQALLVEHAERMAVISDEAGIFLTFAGIYSGGQASFDVALQGHAGTAMRVDRAGRLAHLDRPALAFGLALQPGTLSDVAGSRRFRDSGLLARFLYAMPPSNVGRRDVRHNQPVPPAVRDEYERQLFALMQDAPTVPTKPRTMALSDPARECWYSLAEEIELQQGEGGQYESIADWTGKLPGAAARIAGLLELAEMGLQAECVSELSMQRAVALARLLVPHAQAAFGLLGADGADVDAAAIVKWVQAGQLADFTRRECQKAMEGRFRNIERLSKALTRLDQQNVLQELKRHNRGAPASMYYRVNPKVLST